jgi:hypothetical protein
MAPGGRQPSWSGTACYSPTAQVSAHLNTAGRASSAVDQPRHDDPIVGRLPTFGPFAAMYLS